MGRLLHTLRRHRDAVAVIARVCRDSGESLWRALASAARLFFFGRFSIKEIIGYELFRPGVRARAPLLISKDNSLAKLARFNPRAQQDRVENKLLFCRESRTAALPIPRHFGLFHPDEGLDAGDHPLRTRADWVAYFDTALPAHFIVKDVAGVYGSGFRAFERTDDGYVQIGGGRMSAAGLYDLLAGVSGGGLILQERLFNHPLLAEQFGSAGLCTLRVTTFINDQALPEVLFYFLKIPVGTNISDNFSMGATGNLIAVGEPGTGVLRGARSRGSNGAGLRTIHTHPTNGRAIDGFAIPLWQEAVELAMRAHEVFRDFGALGWDLALTAQGPVILEANPWWDPPLYAPDIMTSENWQRVFA